MSDSTIAAIHGRQVWDSRGRPTVEVEVTLDGGATGRSIAPSGASTGRREALDLRDGGTRLGGFGVNRALAAVNGPIATLLTGMDATDQIGIDAALLELDGTPQKTSLGGNAIVATSGAVAWAAAAAQNIPLWQHLRALAGMPLDAPHIPAPMIQIFGGGRHAGNRIDIQDYLILCLGAKTFAEACEWTAEVYFAASKAMRARGKLNGIADEGGVWPDFTANEDGLELLTAAIARRRLHPRPRHRHLPRRRRLLVLRRRRLHPRPRRPRARQRRHDRNARSAGASATPSSRSKTRSPRTTTPASPRSPSVSAARSRSSATTTSSPAPSASPQAAGIGACNAALLKSNQCGTLTELIAATQTAKALGWNTIMSGRSGESEDVTLSHLAVGLMADQIKVGSITRSERTAKWNEVIRIEEDDWQAASSRWTPSWRVNPRRVAPPPLAA